jgi:hypothetical protein
MEINLYAAWLGMMLGALTGAVQGLFFHKDEWMGGYGSWRRRMTRLGHIAFFGIAFVNIGFASTVHTLEINSESVYWASILLIVAQIGMPVICYLSAFIKPFRNLFFIPVLSVVGAVINLLIVMF